MAWQQLSFEHRRGRPPRHLWGHLACCPPLLTPQLLRCLAPCFSTLQIAACLTSNDALADLANLTDLVADVLWIS